MLSHTKTTPGEGSRLACLFEPSSYHWPGKVSAAFFDHVINLHVVHIHTSLHFKYSLNIV